MNHNGIRLITLALCSLLWISSSHAEDKPSWQAGEPKDGQYRLSGALLFVNWDSVAAHILDPEQFIHEITTMPIGELFRKAQIFSRI